MHATSTLIRTCTYACVRVGGGGWMSHLIHWIHLPTCSFTLVVVHCNECTVHMDKLEYILCHITVECYGVCWKKNTHVLWGKGYNNG